MLILNCGGTFNKRYNDREGVLEVPYDNSAVEAVLETLNYGYSLAGLVYKDSLEMDINDRKSIVNIIMESKEKQFIIIHGTDTMHLSAEFLDAIFDDRQIIFTGAMKPFEIDNAQASLNLGMALGYARGNKESGVYICMSGFVEPWSELVKNRAIGKFELV